MHSMKKLGLGAVLAVAATAAIGVSSASAVPTAVACYSTANAPSCAAGDLVPNNTTFEAQSSTKISLAASINNTCDMAIAGTITNNGASTGIVTGSVTSATFSSCLLSPTVAVNLPWGLSIGTNPGTITGAGADITAPLIGHCVFKDAGAGLTGTWTNGSATVGSSLTLSGSLPKSSGSALCGGTGAITGSVIVTKVGGVAVPSGTNLYLLGI